MIINTAILISNVTVGFLGSGHCVGMCGGIVTALGLGIQQERSGKRLALVLSYNLGRLLTYGILGILAGWLTMTLMPPASFWRWPRLLAGLFMVLMGLYVTGWWLGLTYLERLGQPLWRHISPITRKLLPIRNPGQAILAGLIWGWLPCGMVYSALAVSAVQAQPLASGLSMLAFGLGTLPTMMLSGALAGQLTYAMQRFSIRQVAGLLLIFLGLWTWYGARPMHHPMTSMPGMDMSMPMPHE